ncbi:cellulase family glycosylhydrolase [Opitutus sp. ER46]|uniref:glycoside hydrolase family 5 protein n=1 Tax=Opitutus sp. ER46 TaxID=2161864 RepID=UPI000D30FF1C|nr:cellulase family glycosylhydrolase [Opitutus sp. ER46]PTX98644.1 hypothetical protein DB354_03930 [Opitutus sp. ER46]
MSFLPPPGPFRLLGLAALLVGAALPGRAGMPPAPELPAPPVEAPRRSAWPEQLHVAGPQLLTASGRPAWLQGIHVVSLEWTPRGENVLRATQVALDDWKANVIRLSVRDDYWDGRAKGQTDGGAAYRALVDAVITLAANRGAYTVIDLHLYRAVREEHVVFWEKVARLYGNHPAVLFDLLNEPHSISWDVWRNGGEVTERTKPADEDAFLSAADRAKAVRSFRSPGMQAVVNAIRATGARNVIIAGGLDWAYDLSGVVQGYALEDKTGHGIMYSTHIYPWKSDWQGKVLVAAAKFPIFVGEVGCDVKRMPFIPPERHEDPYTWAPDVLGLIQKHHLHWTAFSFHPVATPVLISDWNFTPTPFWGEFAKAALQGRHFELKRLR